MKEKCKCEIQDSDPLFQVVETGKYQTGLGSLLKPLEMENKHFGRLGKQVSLECPAFNKMRGFGTIMFRAAVRNRNNRFWLFFVLRIGITKAIADRFQLHFRPTEVVVIWGGEVQSGYSGCDVYLTA